jgi:hypothetical protein
VQHLGGAQLVHRMQNQDEKVLALLQQTVVYLKLLKSVLMLVLETGHQLLLEKF